jgi:hypothetical protein
VVPQPPATDVVLAIGAVAWRAEPHELNSSAIASNAVRRSIEAIVTTNFPPER